MFNLKMIALLTITGSSLIAGSSITYYYGYALPKKDQAVLAWQKSKPKDTPTLAPTVTQTPTASPSATPLQAISQWTFSNTQYDVTISNVIYPALLPTPTCGASADECNYQKLIVQAEHQLGNTAEVTIKNISISPLISGFVLYNCQTNNPTIHATFTLVSPSIEISPRETRTEKVTGDLLDGSGNKVNPSIGIKVSSCTISPSTINGATIEPKTIQFSQ